MMQALRKILPWVVIVATAYFFGSTLYDNWEQISAVSFVPDYLTLLGVLLLAASVVSSGLLWGRLLGRLSGDKVSAKESVRIHNASWLLKYIPGQVGSLINKLSWASKNGISKKATTNSFVYENVLLFFASVLPTAPILALLFFDNLRGEWGTFMPLLALLPLLVVANKRVFYGLVSTFLARFFKQDISSEFFLGTKELLRYQAMWLLPRVLNGAGFVFIAASLLTVTPDMYIGLGAAYVLAGIIGLLAIFVPSGIGVREAVIVLFASAYFPLEEAVLLSVVARFYATLADLVVFIIYLYLNKWRITQS